MSRRAASVAVLTARTAVTRSLADLNTGEIVLVACSGGADSLALAGTVAWAAQRDGREVVAVVVDHGLQEGSAAIADQAAATCRALGVHRAVVVPVTVGRSGGPEAAARDARYAALESVAVETRAATILLGHTREDQAETVLLRLARGSGARSLAGMRERSGPWRRPFLTLPRSLVRTAAEELLAAVGAVPWDDPHNEDPAYARVRVRRLLDQLTDAIGPGAVLGLTRSADLLRDDADALEELATQAHNQLVTMGEGECSADGAALARLSRAVRTRLIRMMCLQCGCPAEDLTVDHVRSIDALVTDWHGQGPTSLPGGVLAHRTYGRLCLRPPD